MKGMHASSGGNSAPHWVGFGSSHPWGEGYDPHQHASRVAVPRRKRSDPRDAFEELEYKLEELTRQHRVESLSRLEALSMQQPATGRRRVSMQPTAA